MFIFGNFQGLLRVILKHKKFTLWTENSNESQSQTLHNFSLIPINTTAIRRDRQLCRSLNTALYLPRSNSWWFQFLWCEDFEIECIYWFKTFCLHTDFFLQSKSQRGRFPSAYVGAFRMGRIKVNTIWLTNYSQGDKSSVWENWQRIKSIGKLINSPLNGTCLSTLCGSAFFHKETKELVWR